MRGRFGGVLVEIGCLAAMAALSIAVAVTLEPERPDDRSAVYTLHDGTRVEASTDEEMQQVQETYRGRIASAEIRDSSTRGRRLFTGVFSLLTLLALYVGVRNRADLPTWLKPSPRQFAIGAGAGAALLTLGLGIDALLEALDLRPDVSMAVVWQEERAWAFLFMVAVLAPLAEELYFRGRLLDAVDGAFGRVAAILATSLLFALVHGVPVLIPTYVVVGAALASLRFWTGGLWAPIVAHTVNNGVAVWL